MKKVEIRELEFEDIDFILEIENNEDIWKVSHTQMPFSVKEIEYFIASNKVEGLDEGQKRWVISANDKNAGFIDLFEYDKNNKRAGVGIVIHKKYQNKGIAKLALEQFISFAKNDLKLHQLYCSIFPDNNNSIKLFTGFGFKETGMRKDWTYYKGKYYDEVFYQLIF